jgi:hypothetical protein
MIIWESKIDPAVTKANNGQFLRVMQKLFPISLTYVHSKMRVRQLASIVPYISTITFIDLAM